MLQIVYSPKYDLPAHYFAQRLHPFDLKKYSRAYGALFRAMGPRLRTVTIRPPRAIARDELLLVHSPGYLEQLQQPAYLATALEVPLVAKLPARLTDYAVLRSMRWGAMGTLVAARVALESGMAVNLSGGYHHAKPGGGEGFCIYADAAIAVAALRRDELLGENDRFVHVDLDAHQGNGVCHCFRDDSRAFLFDMYNAAIYPRYDFAARQRLDCDIPVWPPCRGEEYLANLRDRLPGFLDSVGRSERIGLAIYNAGTDVFVDDQLGGLSLCANDLLARDLSVLGELRQRRVPTVMLLSGGYSNRSYELIAATVERLAAEDI